MRSRICRRYRDLRTVEGHIVVGADAGTRAWAEAEPDRSEHEVAQISVPLVYADQLCNLRLEIHFVRRELNWA